MAVAIRIAAQRAPLGKVRTSGQFAGISSAPKLAFIGFSEEKNLFVRSRGPIDARAIRHRIRLPPNILSLDPPPRVLQSDGEAIRYHAKIARLKGSLNSRKRLVSKSSIIVAGRLRIVSASTINGSGVAISVIQPN